MKKAIGCLLLVFWLWPGPVAAKQGAASADGLHAEIQKLYNFQPHTLTTSQIDEDSKRLDEFWAKAKSQKEAYVPGLRRELADASNPTFFFFDGSQLLLSLSNDPTDRNLVLQAVVKSDLRDVQPLDYFLLVHRMAAENEDTTAAAFRVLGSADFKVYVAQHALTLAQDYCLIYMLLPTAPEFWIGPAVERLKREHDETAERSLLLLLWYAQTPDADKAIAEFSKDTGKLPALREYAGELFRRNVKAGTGAEQLAPGSSEDALRKARRERMKAVSDEALEDLDAYTAQIIAKRK